MVNLYITQDLIGTPTGGGAVTYHEYKALESLGVTTHPIDAGRVRLTGNPFLNDDGYAEGLKSVGDVALAHLYAGCFTNTVRLLNSKGAKVSYTAAAHDIRESRREFEELGLPFDFPHLVQPELWEKYVGGYRQADLVICPSKLSKACMESYGCRNVVVIPHGCDIPKDVAPLPKKFAVGYLGQGGPDKGLRYLFAAWKKLALKDATLIVAGNNISSALPLWRKFGGGNVEFMGFVENISEFFGRISLYVQPSVTEGFGMEVLEAQAHARAVLCSRGAGACDAATEGNLFDPRNIDQMAGLIDRYRSTPALMASDGLQNRREMSRYAWEQIRSSYVTQWRSLSRVSKSLLSGGGR
jgi:glycosyltransferase involved in cell wall biosynthesis